MNLNEIKQGIIDKIKKTRNPDQIQKIMNKHQATKSKRKNLYLFIDHNNQITSEGQEEVTLFLIKQIALNLNNK